MDYAIIKTGGKQYRVSAGDVIDVDKLSVEEGASVELTDVLLLSQGETVTVGTPGIEGARVMGTIEQHGRGKKIVVFRFKSKTRQGKKTGHRQDFTRLRITDILTGDAPKPRRRRARATAKETSDGA